MYLMAPFTGINHVCLFLFFVISSDRTTSLPIVQISYVKLLSFSYLLNLLVHIQWLYIHESMVSVITDAISKVSDILLVYDALCFTHSVVSEVFKRGRNATNEQRTLQEQLQGILFRVEDTGIWMKRVSETRLKRVSETRFRIMVI